MFFRKPQKKRMRTASSDNLENLLEMDQELDEVEKARRDLMLASLEAEKARKAAEQATPKTSDTVEQTSSGNPAAANANTAPRSYQSRSAAGRTKTPAQQPAQKTPAPARPASRPRQSAPAAPAGQQQPVRPAQSMPDKAAPLPAARKPTPRQSAPTTDKPTSPPTQKHVSPKPENKPAPEPSPVTTEPRRETATAIGGAAKKSMEKAIQTNAARSWNFNDQTSISPYNCSNLIASTYPTPTLNFAPATVDNQFGRQENHIILGEIMQRVVLEDIDHLRQQQKLTNL